MPADLHLETTPAAVRAARRYIRESIRSAASETIVDDIEVAVGEALANAYLHAYGAQAGPVDVWLSLGEGQFGCAIRDYGRSGTIPAVPSAPRATGGRGLYLIRRLMDGVSISCPDGVGRGVEVRMRKTLWPVPGAAETAAGAPRPRRAAGLRRRDSGYGA